MVFLGALKAYSSIYRILPSGQVWWSAHNTWYRHLIANSLKDPALPLTLTWHNEKSSSTTTPLDTYLALVQPHPTLFLDVDPVFKSGLAWRRIFTVSGWISPSQDDTMTSLLLAGIAPGDLTSVKFELRSSSRSRIFASSVFSMAFRSIRPRGGFLFCPVDPR